MGEVEGSDEDCGCPWLSPELLTPHILSSEDMGLELPAAAHGGHGIILAGGRHHWEEIK